MNGKYSIKLCEQRFSFASSHFLIFDGGERESLHGHNYSLAVNGSGQQLSSGMLFDFTKLAPIIDRICQRLDHLVLLPANNQYMTINDVDTNYSLQLASGEFFTIPKSDILILPISNTSAEQLAEYPCHCISRELDEKYNFCFDQLEVEVAECVGNLATFKLDKHDL